MATIKTFRTTGPLTYNDIDDNFDNLNSNKIERLVNVNDSEPAVEITQSGAGEALVVNSDDLVVVNGKVGVGTSNPQSTLDVAGTDGISIPSGTRAQRGTKKATFRYNDDEKTWEGFDGRVWNRFPTPLNIQKITCSGYNGIQVFGDGEVYFTSGTTGAWPVYTNGHTSNYISKAGFENFTKIEVPDTSPIIDAGSLGHHSASYILCENGNLYTWGYNSNGQLGLGNTSNVATPTLSTTNVSKVFTSPTNGAYGIDQSKLIIQKTDGYLYGVGYNASGQLGDGTTNTKTTWVQLTAFGQNPKSVWNLGNTYGCIFVQRADGRLFTAGYNGWGQLGDGASSSFGSPKDVTSAWLNNDTSYEVKYISGGFGTVVSAVSSNSSVILFADNGTNTLIKTAGSNSNYELGDGTTTTRTTPITLSFPARVKQLLAFGTFSRAVLLENGNLYTWGYNGQGQLGTTPANVTTPTIVQTNVSYIPLLGAEAHTYSYYSSLFVVKTDGYLYATGYNAYGNLTIGTNSNANSFTKCIIPNGPNNKIKLISMYSTASNGKCFIGIREDNELFGWGYNANYGVRDGASSNDYRTAHNFKINRV